MSDNSLSGISDALSKAMHTKPRDDWQSYYYTPEEGAAYAAEVAEIEAALDEGWPEWRQCAPFGHLPMSKIEWIKVRLKRIDLIKQGKGTWGLRIQRRHDAMSVVVPVQPRGDLRRDPYRPIVSVPLLARELGVRPRDVSKALSVMPSNVRAAAGWVESYIKAERQGVQVPASPPPTERSGPLPSLVVSDDAMPDDIADGEE